MIERGECEAIYSAFKSSACSEDAVADQFGIPVSAVNYLLKVQMRRMREAENLGRAMTDHAQRHADRVAEIATMVRTRGDWNPFGTGQKDRIRAGEFTFDELCMVKGNARGSYAKDYTQALDLLSFQIPESIKFVLREFIALCQQTFDARRVRRRQARQNWAQKQADDLLTQQNGLPAAA